MIEYHCPCGKEYLLNDALSGKSVECYQCHTVAVVDSAKGVIAKALKPTEELTAKKLSSPFLLLNRSFRFYEERMFKFTVMGLLRGFFDLLPILPYLTLKTYIDALSFQTQVGILILAGAIAFMGSVWHPLALLSIIADHDVTLWGAFRSATKKYIHFLTIFILIVFVSLGGFLLFQSPKIYLAIALNFGLIIFMNEKAHGAKAQKAEGHLTRGYRWAILGRMVLAVILFECALFIPRTGIGIVYFFYSVLPIYIYAIFEELKIIQREEKAD